MSAYPEEFETNDKPDEGFISATGDPFELDEGSLGQTIEHKKAAETKQDSTQSSLSKQPSFTNEQDRKIFDSIFNKARKNTSYFNPERV